MTGDNVLLDTNIVIELFKGNQKIITNLGDRQLVHIPFAVLGELLLGAYRSRNTQKHLKQIQAFLKKCRVINADEVSANEYAIIKTMLLVKGKPIPENDIWIAATARQHKLTLITMDKHFREVDGISTENWN